MAKPLDGAAAAKYGDLVNAAYDMFLDSPTNLKPPPSPKFSPDWALIAWIDMSDFILGLTDPRFYGVVLQASNPAMMGFDYAIAIRGTEGAVEWYDDAMGVPIPFAPVPGLGRVAYGFQRIYSTLNVTQVKTERRPQLAGQPIPQTFAEQIDALVASSPPLGLRTEADTGEPHGRFLVTAHSLGAALATLYVMENTVRTTVNVDTLCTFASPRVGWAEFVDGFNGLQSNGLTSWRITNVNDVVTWLPPKLIGYRDVDAGYDFSGAHFADNTPLCMHHMATYQHYLDPAHYKIPDGCSPTKLIAAGLVAPAVMQWSRRSLLPDAGIEARGEPSDEVVRFSVDVAIPRATLP